MIDLENEKLQAEIDKLRAEKQSLYFRTAFETVKTLLIFLGAIFTFFLLQNPESILKRQSSQVQISSDRLALIKEIINEPNRERRQQLISALKAANSNTNDWMDYLDFIEAQLSQEKSLDTAAELSKDEDLMRLVEKKKQRIRELEDLLRREIEKGAFSGHTGFGKVARSLKLEIEKLNAEISVLLEEVSSE